MWAKIPDDFAEEPRHLELGARIAAGVLLRVAGMCHCAKHLTDGFVHEDVVPRLMYVKGEDNTEIADALVSCGVWQRVEDGYRDVDYLRWNPSAETYRSWSEAGKKASLTSWEKRRSRQQTSDTQDEAQSESLDASESRTRPVPVPVVVSESVVVSDSANGRECVDALMARFPDANRSDLNNTIMDEWLREDGPAVIREAVRRTITHARSANPTKYLRDCLVSVRRGE